MAFEKVYPLTGPIQKMSYKILHTPDKLYVLTSTGPYPLLLEFVND